MAQNITYSTAWPSQQRLRLTTAASVTMCTRKGFKAQVRREAIKLPDAAVWEWRDEWHIDASRVQPSDSSSSGSSSSSSGVDETDEDGWEYAIDFSHFSLVSRGRKQREFDQARRRDMLCCVASCDTDMLKALAAHGVATCIHAPSSTYK
eukprot:5002-Heterococcus_DN1.PRE.2